MRRSIEFQQQYYADDGGMWMETQAQQQGYASQEESWRSGNNYHNRFPAMHINKLNAFAMDSGISMSKHANKLASMHMNMLDEFALDSNLFMSKQHNMLGSMPMNGVGTYAMGSQLSNSKHHHDKLLGSMHMNKVGAYCVDSEFSKSKHHGKLGKSHGMFQEGVHREHGFSYGHGGGRKFNNSGGQREYYSEETKYEEAYAEEHAGAATAKVEEMRYQQHNWVGDGYCVNPYGKNKKRNMNWWTEKGV